MNRYLTTYLLHSYYNTDIHFYLIFKEFAYWFPTVLHLKHHFLCLKTNIVKSNS